MLLSSAYLLRLFLDIRMPVSVSIWTSLRLMVARVFKNIPIGTRLSRFTTPLQGFTLSEFITDGTNAPMVMLCSPLFAKMLLWLLAHLSGEQISNLNLYRPLSKVWSSPKIITSGVMFGQIPKFWMMNMVNRFCFKISWLIGSLNQAVWLHGINSMLSLFVSVLTDTVPSIL